MQPTLFDLLCAMLLGAVLGAIFGPMSYEAGIHMGAGAWGPNGQLGGLIAIAIVWAIAIPLFFYWVEAPTNHSLLKKM